MLSFLRMQESIIISAKIKIDSCLRRNDKKMSRVQKKYYCPCCGYNALSEESAGTFEICDICYWEDDNVQFNDIHYSGGANKGDIRILN